MGPAGLRVDARRGLPLPLPPPLLLLLLLLLPPPAPGVTCPPPSAIEHADIQVRSHRQGSRERYACYSGFKRKAGTSSLTECVYNETTRTARWTRPTLQCIRDPSLAPRQPPSTSTAAPAAVTAKPQSPSPTGKDVPTYDAAHVTRLLSVVPLLAFCGLALLCALCYWRWRRGSRPRGVATESPEELPMTEPFHEAEGEPGNRPA